MKKKDSFIKIPAFTSKSEVKAKKGLFSFAKKIKLPKLGSKTPKQDSITEEDAIAVEAPFEETPAELPVEILETDSAEAANEAAAAENSIEKASTVEKPVKKAFRKNNKADRPDETKNPTKKKFNLSKMFSGLRGRIIILVALITLIPLLVQTAYNVKTQGDTVRKNLEGLSQAINQGLVERINATLNQSIATLELIPKSIDILSFERLEQERIMRKMADKNFKDVFIVNLNGVITAATDAKDRDVNVSQEDWFKNSVGGTRYVSDAKNEARYKGPVIRIAVPLLDQFFKPAGVIVAVYGMDTMQTILDESDLGDDTVAYLVGRTGTVLAHPEYKEKVINNYNAVENNIQGAIKVTSGESGTSNYNNDKGQRVVGTYSVIPATQWGLITEIEESKAMADVKQVTKTGLVFMFIAFGIAIAGSLVLAWAITKPLVGIAKVASEIKEGNFKIRVKVTSNDEIGELQTAFNLMSESLSQIVTEVGAAVQEISYTSNKLSGSAQITSAATDEITSIVEDVAEGAQTQIRSVRSSLNVAREISDSVVVTSDKTQKVSLSAKEAAQVAKNGSENINIISEKIGVIKNNVVNSAELVDKLGKKSEEVTGIVKVIRDIAGKTNMLALNAAIEAARAGEAGKGFAVVANEIRNLADQTKEASKNIETLLLEIQKETELTVSAMNEGLIEVEEGTAAIGATYSTFNKIIEEIHLVADEIQLVSESVLELKQESERISKAVEEVNDIAEATSMGTQSVLASTEEQSSAMQEINDSAAKLSKMAAELQDSMKRFKI
ncbi:MAG: methyl-accepting chemotaxis protein [Bacillota bacterium]